MNNCDVKLFSITTSILPVDSFKMKSDLKIIRWRDVRIFMVYCSAVCRIGKWVIRKNCWKSEVLERGFEYLFQFTLKKYNKTKNANYFTLYLREPSVENPWDDPWLPNFSGRLEGRAWEGLSVEDVPAMEPMDWSNKLLSLLLSPSFSELNIYQKMHMYCTEFHIINSNLEEWSRGTFSRVFVFIISIFLPLERGWFAETVRAANRTIYVRIFGTTSAGNFVSRPT